MSVTAADFRLSFHVLDWEAWAGSALSDKSSWRVWAATSDPWENRAAETAPVASMPPILRRRADAADRLGLEIAFRLSPRGEGLPAVFSTRHGQVTRSTAMLKAQAAGEPASPMDFSLSVHNATAGQYSIAAGDRHMSSSLSARGEGFTAALLEGQGLVAEGHPKVMVVVSDPVPPEEFRGRWDGEPAGYGFGLILGAEGGEEFELSAAHAGTDAATGWPQALVFLKALAGGRAEAAWQRGGRRWTWTRA